MFMTTATQHMTSAELTRRIKTEALELGFDKVGVAAARPTGQDERLHLWLEHGYHGTMQWMNRNIDKRLDPTKLVSGAKSIVAVAMNYYTPHEHANTPDTGKISRYAWGDDYHDVLKARLRQLLETIQSWQAGVEGRCFVDTAPIMDKYWAVQAGLGWLGKHTNVITRDMGSWVFLGEIVLNVELEYDTPMTDFCGTCKRCIDACPTDAIVEPYVLEATRCISYWTIEHRGDIDPVITAQMDNWIFGCDICQDVCPWNIKFAVETQLEAFQPRPGLVRPTLADLADLTEDAFRTIFRKSMVKRPKFAGFKRNIQAVWNNSAKF